MINKTNFHAFGLVKLPLYLILLFLSFIVMLKRLGWIPWLFWLASSAGTKLNSSLNTWNEEVYKVNCILHFPNDHQISWLQKWRWFANISQNPKYISLKIILNYCLEIYIFPQIVSSLEIFSPLNYFLGQNPYLPT